MSVLAIRSLSKAFGGVRAVNDVSFEIGEGEFLAMIGPNGAGKSTCFNMINGQLKPDSGQILFEGKDIAGLAPRVIWRIADATRHDSGKRVLRFGNPFRALGTTYKPSRDDRVRGGPRRLRRLGESGACRSPIQKLAAR